MLKWACSFVLFCHITGLTAQDGMDLSGFTGYSNQDRGTGTLSNNNRTLRISGNGWKKVPVNYTITPNTILSFEIRVDGPGEIHGILFDTNNNFNFGTDTPRGFRFFGSQNWGNADFANYPGSGWQGYQIPVGEYYTGTFQYLVFIADKDSGGSSQDSTFRNVLIYEKGKNVLTNRRITFRVIP